MNTSVKLFLILILLISLEIIYYAVAGSMVLYFSPKLLLMGSVFSGILCGASSAVVWGLAAGLLEELCFMGPQSILGITPLVYCWGGFLAGRFFHGRADAGNPAIGLVLSCASLLFGFLGGTILGKAFGVPVDLLAGPLTFGSGVSYVLDAFFVGPLLLRLFIFTTGSNQSAFFASRKRW